MEQQRNAYEILVVLDYHLSGILSVHTLQLVERFCRFPDHSVH